MIITEVCVQLAWRKRMEERLVAYCSVTFDQVFVVHDLKVLEGEDRLFIAMPSRKLADRCPWCDGKNHLLARFCNQCGSRLKKDRAPRDADGRAKLHDDVAHPITAAYRGILEEAVLQAYRDEKERAEPPGEARTGDDGRPKPDFGTGILD